jgi:hypothetical protein
LRPPPGGPARRCPSRGEDYRQRLNEAHIRKSGGTEVEVEVSQDFEVTVVEEHAGRP